MSNDAQSMIIKFTNNIADEMGIQLSKVSVIEGRDVGCIDTHLLKIVHQGQIGSALLYQSDIDNLQGGLPCDRLELKIRSTLSRLKTKLKS